MNIRFPGASGISLYTLVDVNTLGEIEPATGQSIGYIAEILDNGASYSVSVQDLLIGRSNSSIAVGESVKIEDGVFIVDGNGSFRVIESNGGLLKAIPMLSAGGGGGGSYTLPTASQTVKGGIKVGDNLEINGSEFLSVPVATIDGELGVVAVDGTTVMVDANGVISASGGGGGGGEAFVLSQAIITFETNTPSANISAAVGGAAGFRDIAQAVKAKRSFVIGEGGSVVQTAQMTPQMVMVDNPDNPTILQISSITTGPSGSSMLAIAISFDGVATFACVHKYEERFKPKTYRRKFTTTNPIFTGDKDFYLSATDDFRNLSFNMSTLVSPTYVKGANELLYRGAGIPGEWFFDNIDGITFIPIYHCVNPFFPGRPFFSGTLMMQYHGVDDVEIYISFDYSDTSDWNCFLTGMVPNAFAPEEN